MKTNPWLALTLTLFLFCARGQIPLPLPANGPVVVEAGPHHRIWRTVAVDEQGQTHIGSFTEIATGLNYFDPVTKQWQESRAQFQIAPDGSAIATNGQHQVILSADINSGGSVDLLMPDGQRLLSNPMGLSFFDTASGMNVLIAEVTNCIGQLIGSNQVLYANAFDTLKGAIRYTYTRDGFEQDLILYENPGSPADYGLNPATTRLEMYTEFHNHPTPQLRTHPPANGSEDETVSFGQMQVVRGASYVLNDVLEAVGVEKTWARIDGRQFLIESVNYNAVQPLLEKVQASAGRATKTRVAKVTFSERRQFVSQLLRTKKKESRVARITPAGSSPKSGLVMDYLLLNTSQANYTFKGDTTYYVSGIVNLSGTTILEGGAVIKYTNNAQINITGSGAILSCKTSSYRPAIFTSKDDNSVGDTISGSDGNPSDSYHANVALNFDYYSSGYPANLQYVRFTYLNNGIGFFGGTGHVLSHAQFAYCNSALNVYYTDYSLRNVLIASVNNVFNNSASCSGRGEHLTIHSANNMCSYGVSPVTLFLTNSVLAAVSNPGSYSGSNNGVTSTDTGVFQSAGAGYHYLASESPYRNAGTTSINSTLLSELKKKTTYPPVVLTSDFNVSTTLSPQVQRDTDTPDLGYHYDPLDYCWSGLNILNNVSVTLTNGVAVGLYGTQGTLLQNASKLISEGTPSAMNRLTRYSTVQEQAVIWGTSGTTFSIFAFNGSITTGPEVRLAFTDVSLLAAPISKRRLLYNGGTRSTLSLQDCWLRGGYVYVYPSDSSIPITVALTNNLVQCCYLDLFTSYYGTPFQLNFYSYNNLFQGGTLSLNYGYTYGTWAITDNLFDTVMVSLTQYDETPLSASYNAYKSTTSLGGSNNKTLTTCDYQTGTLGSFYYPTTGGQLSSLIDAGSRTAEAAALPHHTVRVDQTQEAATQVDIGFHYLAVDANGQPVDTDNDGIPDCKNTALVAHWRLDEQSGTIATDSSGYGHTGTLVNSPTWMSGLVGGALSFDGVNDQVTVADTSALRITGDLTIAFWMNKSAHATDWERLVGKGNSLRNYGVWLEPGSGSPGSGAHILFQQLDSSGGQVLSLLSSRQFGVGCWYHVAVVVSGSAAYIYINGALDVSGTRTGTPAVSADPLTLGYAGYLAPFAGLLDEVQVYKRALSGSEILALAIAPNRAPTVSAWPDQTVILPNRANFYHTETDDRLPRGHSCESYLSIGAYKLSGPGDVIGFPGIDQGWATFSEPGAYVLRVEASDGQLSGHSDIVVNVLSSSTVNQPPVVDAGRNRSVIKPASGGAQITLEGFVTDDGLPSGSSLSISWAVDEQPTVGAVTFSDVTSPTSPAVLTTIGRYVLRLTADDGSGAISDTVTINVCQEERKPRDIMLLAEHSRYAEWTPELNYAFRRASQFIDFLSPETDRAGLISYSALSSYSEVYLQHVLTQDLQAVKNASPWLQTIDSTLAVADAIRAATIELTGPRRNQNALPVIVLFSAMGENTLTPWIDKEDAVAAANEAKAKGIQIVSVGLYKTAIPVDPATHAIAEDTLKKIASDPSADYYAVIGFSTGIPLDVKQSFQTIVDRFCSSKRIGVEAGVLQGGGTVKDPTIARPSNGNVNFQLTVSATSPFPPITYQWQLVTEWSAGPAQISNPALQSPTVSISGAPNPGTYIFRVTATDFTGVSGTAHVVVKVTSLPVDDLVVIEKGSENVLLAPLQNDPNNALYKLDIWLPPDLGGTAEVTPDGKMITYTPVANYDGTFEYIEYYWTDLNGQPVFGEGGEFLIGQIKAFISPLNEPPVARDDPDYIVAPSSGPTQLNVFQNDSDVNPGDRGYYPFRIVEVTQPENGLGSVTFDPNEPYYVTYTPPGSGATGVAMFTYTVRDTYGALSKATVRVTVSDNPQLFAQKAKDDVAVVLLSETVKYIDVLANDLPQGQPNTIVSPPGAVTPGNAGTATVAPVDDPNNPFGRPAIKFNVNDRSLPATFSYRLFTGSNPDHQATVTVGFEVNMNNPPHAEITKIDNQAVNTEAPPIVKKGIVQIHGVADDTDAANVVVRRLIVWSMEDDQLVAEAEYVGKVPALPDGSGGYLGDLDLTKVPDGAYRLQLIVADDGEATISLGGNDAVDWQYFFLQSPFKLGRFSFTETDLSIPVEGMPITFARTYDSRDPAVGDFGPAWRLAVGGGKLTKNGILGKGWAESGTCAVNAGHQVVTIELDNGEVFKFVPILVNCSGGTASGVAFDLFYGPGGSTLAVQNYPEGTDPLFVVPSQTGQPGEMDIWDVATELFDPEEFKLTHPDGRTFTFRNGRLVAFKDRNGNEITIGTDGSINHSKGKSVRVQRNTDGLVTKIVSPSEWSGSLDGSIGTVLYEYAQYGSTKYLARVKRLTDKSDPANPKYQTTTYVYPFQAQPPVDFPPGQEHYITEIKNQLGLVVRNEYDEDGRLSATIDGNGNATRYDYHDGLTQFFSSAAKGRTTITDALGHSTIHEYDRLGNIVFTRNALGKDMLHTYYYDTLDRTQWEIETDPLGNSTRRDYTYYGDSDVINTLTVTLPHDPALPDSAFRTITTFNDRGQPTQVTDANGKISTIQYVETSDQNSYPNDYVAALGKIKTITDGEQNSTTYTYPANKMRITDALSVTTEHELDTYGYISKTTVKNSSGVPVVETWFTYDLNGNRQTETVIRKLANISNSDKEKLETTYKYDAAERLVETETRIQTLNSSGTGIAPYPTLTLIPNPYPKITYDEAGRKKTETRTRALQNGSLETQVTQYDYDSRGNLIRTTFADDEFEESSYNTVGRLETRTDRAGRVTTFTYDEVGRLKQILHPDKTTTSTDYDDAGRVKSTTDGRRLTTTYGYDPAGRRRSVTDAAQKVSQYEYDGVGNLKTFTDALQRVTTYRYDGVNRRTHVIFHDQTEEVTTYDAFGRQKTVTDQDEVTTSYDYDELGRMKSVTLAAGRPDATTTSYFYDEVGNLLETWDALQRSTKFTYDSFGRRTKRVLPLQQFEQLYYDEVGNLKSRMDFNSKTTTFEYDPINRIVKKSPDPSFNLAPVTFTYTATGQRASMKYPIGAGLGTEEVTYHYLDSDRLWKKITPQGTITYDYDDAGNLKKLTTSRGTVVGYESDPVNRLKSVTDDTIGTTQRTSYDYDDVGNLREVIYPNNLDASYQYNSLNRLKTMTVAPTTALSSPVATFEYKLGNAGNRTEAKEFINGPVNRTVTYAYDPLYRLNSETITGTAPTGSITYDTFPGYNSTGYDKVGNRRSRTVNLTPAVPGFDSSSSLYDNNDWLDTDSIPSNANPNYDPNGNTLTETGVTGTFSYDFENRLTGRSGGGATIQVVYDGDGNRVRKLVDGVATHYLVDDRNPTGYPQVIEESASLTGVPDRAYVYGLDLIAQQRRSGGLWISSFYGYDGNGNVRFLTSTGGSVTDTYTYDAFGTMLTSTGSGTLNNYLYAGEQFDAHLGFYYLRARYLNPNTGRFWTMDSFEGNNSEPLSLHKYLYCHADPVNGVDPTGHEFSAIGIAVANAVGTVLDAFYNDGVINGGFLIQDSLLESLKQQTVAELFVEALTSDVPIDDPVAYVSTRLQEMGVPASDAEAYAFREYFDFAVLPLMLDEADYVDNDLDLQDPDEAGFQCFVAGTKVLTADGLKNIEEIQKGDMVWAYDIASSNAVLKSVLNTFVRERKSLVKLFVNDDLIEVTPEHPFFVLGRGWVRADGLRQDDDLLTFDRTKETHVQRVEMHSGSFLVYNFEVDGLHNYFIADEAVLVHNLGRGYHHFVTRGLGSRIPYGARILRQQGRLSAYQHTNLHKQLNQHLRSFKKRGRTMVPSRNNPGRVVIKNFSKGERLDALRKFYSNYKGGKYKSAFDKEVKFLQQNPRLFK